MAKFLLILLISISSSVFAQTGFLGSEAFPTLNQRLGHGTPYISGTIHADSLAVLEATILKDSGRLKVYYTGVSMPGQTTAICLLTTDSIGGIQKKYGAVAGTGVHTRQANSSDIVKVGGTYYLYAPASYNSASVYLYTSTNGYNFTDQGAVIPISLIPSGVSFGNVGILKDTSGAPVQIAGKYQMYMEANEGSNWMTYLLQSTSLSTGWTFVQKLTSLQVNGGSYSGGCVKYLDGVYHIFFHFSPNNTRVIPTYLAYATSTDGINFNQKEVPYKAFESLPFGAPQPPTFPQGTSQIADMWLEQYKGATYMIAEYFENANPVHGIIYKWKFNGTFKELITNSQICIGCVGIYP